MKSIRPHIVNIPAEDVGKVSHCSKQQSTWGRSLDWQLGLSGDFGGAGSSPCLSSIKQFEHWIQTHKARPALLSGGRSPSPALVLQPMDNTCLHCPVARNQEPFGTGWWLTTPETCWLHSEWILSVWWELKRPQGGSCLAGEKGKLPYLLGWGEVGTTSWVAGYLDSFGLEIICLHNRVCGLPARTGPRNQGYWDTHYYRFGGI